jgi:hypothetical protein
MAHSWLKTEFQADTLKAGVKFGSLDEHHINAPFSAGSTWLAQPCSNASGNCAAAAKENSNV